MRYRVILSISVLAFLVAAAPAAAAPRGADVRAILEAADAQLQGSLADAADGRIGRSAAAADEFVRLARRAARKADAVLARRGELAGGRSLNRVAALADRGIDEYAALFESLPPALQAELIEILNRLAELRGDLVQDVAAVLDSLPDDVAARISAALAAFYGDGDLEALIGALSDPEISAAIESALVELIGRFAETIEADLGDLSDMSIQLPPEIAAQLEAILADLDARIAAAFAQLDAIMAGMGGFGDFCAALEDLGGSLGIPLPPGLCESA